MRGSTGSKTVLITGGAGFIGSHVADELLEHGDAVRVLDNLSPQVHGTSRNRPGYLAPAVEFLSGDVTDRSSVDRAVEGIDGVLHLAGAVGVGQSMYEIVHYTRTNTVGTAVLLEALAESDVERLVVASSMSIYGEGLYRDDGGRQVGGAARTAEQLRQADWEPRGVDGRALIPAPTPESKCPELSSVYALSKYDQERLCLLFGAAYAVPTVALRLFNVFGPRQALSNPYTGVLAIFASRLLNRRPPLIYEDGEQRRDFVSVHDVARAFRLALESDIAPGHAINIGSGEPRTIRGIAGRMTAMLAPGLVQPEVTGRHRVGDVRHCFADISLARELLGYEPAVAFDDGLAELAGWLEGERALDQLGKANGELAARGLIV